MHKLESILENETQKIHWDFDIQTDQLIWARRPDIVLTGTGHRVNFTIPADHKVKIKESKKINKYFGSNKRAEKAGKHEGGSETNCNWCTWKDPQKFGKEARNRRS